MRRLNEWVSRLSFVEAALFIAILWGGLSWIANAILDAPEVDPTAISIRAAGAILFGVVFAAISRRAVRKTGGVTMAYAVADAVKSGSLPANADPAEWLPALSYRERALKFSRWFTPMGAAFFVVLGVVLVAISGSDTRSAIVGIVCAAGFLVLTVVILVLVQRRLAVVRGFITQLESGSPSEGGNV